MDERWCQKDAKGSTRGMEAICDGVSNWGPASAALREAAGNFITGTLFPLLPQEALRHLPEPAPRVNRVGDWGGVGRVR